ncbi:hypothetical protein J6TS2_33100 [Heyndrickxia sporothermodurans]|nr:hypothetical protein J6TS2_33100 [Heyndrickxia sporothermodurans]
MNSISNLLGKLEETLLNLWKSHQEETPILLFYDFYGLVITLWKETSIMDSKLSMEVIHFYYTYKKYKYMLEEEEVVVQQLEYLAQKDFNKIIGELKKLF